ncbi:MAG TPA: thiamine pyrophosphate-dependent enzyme [Thermoanaerobaculia bacterium]|nr:thiamine pyrophosphate-dependent enzyme [Thermoanaerobaculia bacterium]
MTTETPLARTDRVRGLLEHFASFVTERHPFAMRGAVGALQEVIEASGRPPEGEEAIEALRDPYRQALRAAMMPPILPPIPETTPGVSAEERIASAVDELVESCDGFLRREAIIASLTPGEKREILRGMILTRATDNRLKAFFSAGEVRYGNASFQGKGFRSLGQEAIYASVIRLRRGVEYLDLDGIWRGDYVAPMIRDLGVVLGMRPDSETVRMVLNAQMAKSGPPMNGRDFHVGDFGRGILPAAAPLGMSSLSIVGMAMAFSLEGSDRVAVSFIGEGATSLGEWHEAINAAAARRLPAIFCVQNNQTALSTPVSEQSAARVFADKAAGYGIPGITLDGTDPEAIAAAFTWAAERARGGHGPALIDLVCMRMCGHAHHDDMLYLGKEPPISWEYPAPTEQGYADARAHTFWAARDPILSYSNRLIDAGIVTTAELDAWKTEAIDLVEQEARKVVEAPWPDSAEAGENVYTDQPPLRHVEILERDPSEVGPAIELTVEEAPPFVPAGKTFLEAIMLGIGDALRNDPRVFVYGEDVGGRYGNAFLLLKPLLAGFGDRILNSTLAEGAVLGVCIGSALAGRRPIGEIQFNDFVATGFNQLVNNAAKIRYRWGASVPMVVRMPWGGLRHAGPYHSQNTEAWFYRAPGLKIVCPSTPHDARAAMAAAVADPDPVLYYEHIALYRDPRIRQVLDDDAPPMQLGRAALRRDGSDMAIISYGAYAHVAMRVAERLAADEIEASVLDLRSLVPLDRGAILSVARRCNRVLIVEEDTKRGSIGESIASLIQEEAFESLDAPIRVIGSLDTPVPYSPPLEEEFLAGEARIERAARLLLAY